MNAIGSSVVDVVARAAFLAWLSLLAYGLPEIFAGSSPGGLADPGVWVLAVPVYALHVVFLCDVALRLRRLSWPALYLLGVIFGLYETWITKVVWAGYLDAGGYAMGPLLPGFGLHETLGLVLFYHPVSSFLLPVAVLSVLFPAWRAVFPAPRWLLGPGIWGWVRRGGLVGIWGVASGFNLASWPVYLTTWLPWLGVVLGGYALLALLGLTKATGRAQTATRPGLSRLGQMLVLAALIVVYWVSYDLIEPERLPSRAVQLETLAVYALLIALILRTAPASSPTAAQESAREKPGQRAGTGLLLLLLAVFLAGGAILALGQSAPGLASALIGIAFLLMVPLGAGLFAWLGLWRALIRRG